MRKKKHAHTYVMACFLFLILKYRSTRIRRGRPLGPLLYVKGNAVALIEGLETCRIDRRMMDKNIWPIFLLNKSKTFLVAEPLHSSIRHRDTLLSKNSHSSRLQVATLANGSFLQSETDPSDIDGSFMIK